MEIINEKSTSQLRVQLLDTSGRPHGTEVTTLTLTLYNEADGAIINSIDGTNVFNTGGGTYTPTLAITGATNASPVIVTSVTHPLLDGDRIHITGVVGMTELNGRTFEVRRVSDDAFALYYLSGQAVNGIAFGTYTSGGTGKIGLFTRAMAALDNVLSGTVLANNRQRHVAQLLVNAGPRLEHVFEVKQLPQPT